MIRFYKVLFVLMPLVMFSQSREAIKTGQFNQKEFTEFKNFLDSKKLPLKDTIFIKYDFNKEDCWDILDDEGAERINGIKSRFQKHISDFNKNHKGSVAYNFREPGTKINKLKLWDHTIILDDNLFLKKLLFKDKERCGTSAVIMYDGSYLIYFSDPHFELINLISGTKGSKF